VLFFVGRLAAGTALAAAFAWRLPFSQFAWLVGAENGCDHFTLAIAVQVVYAKPRCSYEDRGRQQVNRDMSELLLHCFLKALQK
jgi:hypothetical protein